jgi:hypothetical protein
VHGGRAEIREGRQGIGAVCRGHGDDVRRRIARGIDRIRFRVHARISGGHNEEHPTRIGRIDRVEQGLRVRTTSPAIREDAHVDRRGGAGEYLLHLNRELDHAHRVGGRTIPGCAEKLQAHDLSRPVDAGNSRGVVAYAADGARHMSAVIVILIGVAAPRDGVEPV